MQGRRLGSVQCPQSDSVYEALYGHWGLVAFTTGLMQPYHQPRMVSTAYHRLSLLYPQILVILACRNRKKAVNYSKAGLKGEWDPRGTIFFVKAFEMAFDSAKFCLVWSGIDDRELDQYTVRDYYPFIFHSRLIHSFVADQANGPKFVFSSTLHNT